MPDKPIPNRPTLDDVAARCPLIPVLVIEDDRQAVPLARALVTGGIAAIEITLRSDAALESIRRIAAELPDAVVGAGTVLDRAQFTAARKAGARFIVSPGATDALYDAADGAEIPFLPAVATASEIMRGRERGYRRFKFFPAARAGGIAALKDFAGPFPDVRFCPTGGVGADNFADYLGQPNVFAVGGSWLAPTDKVKAGDWPALTALARAAVKTAGACDWVEPSDA
jgi:2-dehydro-3-deoxyphosphogluconate aldolase/(4S)-4-hydroxy-2-oxoglutarate aldolase